MEKYTGETLLAAAHQRLSEILGDIGATADSFNNQPITGDGGTDAVWIINSSNNFIRLMVEAFPRFTPRDVDQIKAGGGGIRAALQGWEVLVVAPWLSPRSRQALEAKDINYLDLAGNVRLRVSNPMLLIHLQGSDTDPNAVRRPSPRLQGPAVGSLIRTLVDFAPPYRLTDLAAVTGLSPGYVSRALSTLNEERLIARTKRLITDVDWAGLLRLRAEGYDLVQSNQTMTFIAQRGVDQVYRQLAEPSSPKTVVTGSWAAAEYVQITAPTQLMIYAAALGNYADTFGLLPADRGADVFLLRPAAFNQLDRAHQRPNGTVHAAVSQVVIDCLAGNGRLPQEGEALLRWMARHESAWRRRELPAQP